MNAIRHYRRAEALLAEVPDDEISAEEWNATRAVRVAEAQAHARLAAVALKVEERMIDAGMDPDTRDYLWREAFDGS